MAGPPIVLPPEVRRFSGLYRFIGPERFEELGIDPEDVPLGTYPAEDHPPFLPDRFGGNAYGLGLVEHTVLRQEEAEFLDSVDLDDPDDAGAHYRTLNNIFKRLGLLVRISRTGRHFYLIPRQYVAHFLVEVQATADEIVSFLGGLLARRLRETMRVGLVAGDHELLVPEVQTRMPHLHFQVIDSLSALIESPGALSAVVLVGDPKDFALDSLLKAGRIPPPDNDSRENYGYFVASRLFDLLEEDGEILVVDDHPLTGGSEKVQVRFRDLGEFKRFLVFSHVYRTRRRYKSTEGLSIEAYRVDFDAFLTGLGVYHETVEGFLEGKSLSRVEPAEIDELPHQDLPLSRGSAERSLGAWKRWLGEFFTARRMGPVLPQAQRLAWEERYQVDGDLPPTLMLFQGNRRRPPVTAGRLDARLASRDLAGCDKKLLAEYKDSFAYVLKVLAILEEVRLGEYTALPGLELSRLKKPFESAIRHPQMKDVLKLMDWGKRLDRLEAWLNPDHLLGQLTPVLANLDKLSLMGLEEGPLSQLYLMVLGHSTMSRVTFGKLPETTLRPLTDLSHYRDLGEAVTVIRLYRLLSVAEAAAASKEGLGSKQVEEMFSLYDNAIRVVTNPELDWGGILDAQISRAGGVQAKATRKMLKLLDLFDHLDDWQRLEASGPRMKEALADFNKARLARIHQVIELVQQMRRFVGRFYSNDSSARPFFFRALLNCELHGTGRLLPRLGPAASFTLLWICVHADERRLLNFNPLIKGLDGEKSDHRLTKLSRALLKFTPENLSPLFLTQLRGTIARNGVAYLGATGLYLRVDRATGALTPRFMDAAEELKLLKRDATRVFERGLTAVSDARLADMNRRAREIERFLAAQEGALGRSLKNMAGDYDRLAGELERHLAEQLMDLPRFSTNLRRLVRHCPFLVSRLLPRTKGYRHLRRRLDAADKLSALVGRRLEAFQDMKLSHEAALAEFGPNAAGVVGVSPLQFQALTASLAQILERRPELGVMLILGILLSPDEDSPGDPLPDGHKIIEFAGLGKDAAYDLKFLLEHFDLVRQVVDGEACLSSLEPVVAIRDPLLVEGWFILAVITAAAREEGYLTEDLLDNFFTLNSKVRDLTRKDGTAQAAHYEEIARAARHQLAFEHYRDIQEGEAPAASLRHLLETTKLPEEDRQRWLEQGRRQEGLDRLLRLRGLYPVTALDLLMLKADVPVRYIYKLKALRSMGVTHFERLLYEGLRLGRGLAALPDAVQDFMLFALSDPESPVRLSGFATAAERLTYVNQTRLLLVGLAAARRQQDADAGSLTLSFAPLARIIERKFEMVNEFITGLSPMNLLRSPDALERLQQAREGLVAAYSPASRVLELGLSEPASIDRKIEAVRRATSPEKLKRLYHEELKKLKLTSYGTLDYQQRLDAAFQENLARLGDLMLEKVRARMAAEDDINRLEQHFQAAWEEGLELPLNQERQQSLRDLFEMNMERLRSRLLAEINSRLAQVGDFEQLDDLWRRTKDRLRAGRRHLGKDFGLLVAQRFDRRARELRTSHKGTL